MSAATVGTVAVTATVAEPEQGLCNQCLDVWPVDELGEDANGDPQCPDCRSTSEGLADEDARSFRSYCYAGR